MIKGKTKEPYNEFERNLDYLAGDYREGYGLDFFFEQLHSAFLKSEDVIKENSDKYLTRLDAEDDEVKQSIINNDPEYQLQSNPPFEVLRKSYFITVHSEFENIWKEIIKEYNNYFTPIPVFSFNDKFFDPPNFNPARLLDKVAKRHEILVSYNYIRNKMVHQNASTASPEYNKILVCKNSGKMEGLRVEQDGPNVKFFIDSLQFVRDYANAIIEFMHDIIETSLNDRKAP